MSDFTNAMRRELNDLEEALRADPRHEKIKRLRELLTFYEPSQTAHLTRRPPVHATNRFAPKPTGGAPSKTKAMEVAIATLLTAKVQAHRTAILQHLVDAGIMGHEKNPTAHLAAFMSDRRHLYESDGKGNFHLRASESSTANALELELETKEEPIT
jgi:hypothetical protein